MARICILTFEKNPIVAELFSKLTGDHEVYVIYTDNTNLSLKQIWQRTRGARWLWFNIIFKYAAELHGAGHCPTPSWDELCLKHPSSFIKVKVHNSPECRSVLKEHDLDLGILIGTAIIKPDVFGIPRLGMINLHQGNIPHYRGVPPAFWEHYNKEKEMYITVHTVVKKLDAGYILEEEKFSIFNHEHFVISKFYANPLSVKMLQSAVNKTFKGDKGETRAIRGKTNTVPSVGILIRESLELLKTSIKKSR